MKFEGLTMNQLAERNAFLVQELENAREVTNCPDGVDLQDHLKQLVAESLAMKKTLTTIANSEEYHGDSVVCDFDTLVTAAWSALNGTPTTDSILREAEVRGVDKAIEHLLTKFACTGHVGVPVMALEYLAKQLREGKV